MTRHTKEYLAKNNLKILFPSLVEEWDYEKNKALGLGIPEDYSKGSNVSVHWICKKNKSHKFEYKICHRTRKNPINCPECAGRIKKSINEGMPEILSIWDYEKNNNIGLIPSKLSPGSQKRAYFKCECGWEYGPLRIGDIRTRLLKGSEPCPVCNKSIVSDKYNLQICFPEIAKEWDAKKNALKPNQVLPSLNEDFWWICPDEGHSYPLSLNARTNKSAPQNCPVCSGRRVTKENNLETLNPSITKEWDYIKNKKRPSEYTSHSNQPVWWLCKRNHPSYKASIFSRVARGTGCRKCSNQTSKSELRIFSELESIFKEVKHREKINTYEIDIFLPNYSLGIEYDGYFYHKHPEKIIKDQEKNQYLKDKNIELLRIREYPLEPISENDIILEQNNRIKKETLNKIILKIVGLKNLLTPEEYLNKDSFCNQNRYQELIDKLPGPIDGKSLEDKFPEIAIEWDYAKNNPLKPSQFSYGSNFPANWICPKGHQYKKMIKDRTGKQKQGCKICSALRKKKFTT